MANKYYSEKTNCDLWAVFSRGNPLALISMLSDVQADVIASLLESAHEHGRAEAFSDLRNLIGAKKA